MSETVREITERIRRHIDEPMTGGSVTAEDFASRDRTRSLCVPDAQLRLLLDALAARERELAEAERAMREVACPVENCEDQSARFVCLNDDGDPIIEADTLADAIRQMSRCWDSENNRAERLRADLAALEAVEAVEAFNDSGEGFLDIVPSGPRVAFAWSVNSVDSPIRVAGAPTLVALGRALLARKAGDAK